MAQVDGTTKEALQSDKNWSVKNLRLYLYAAGTCIYLELQG